MANGTPKFRSCNANAERPLLRPWLIQEIDKGELAGLSWIGVRSDMIFRMPWKHQSLCGWNEESDGSLFKSWAIHTRRFIEGRDTPNPKKWKANLRCALNSRPDIVEMEDMGQSTGVDAFKVYKFLEKDEVSKKRKNMVVSDMIKEEHKAGLDIDLEAAHTLVGLASLHSKGFKKIKCEPTTDSHIEFNHQMAGSKSPEKVDSLKDENLLDKSESFEHTPSLESIVKIEPADSYSFHQNANSNSSTNFQNENHNFDIRQILNIASSDVNSFKEIRNALNSNGTNLDMKKVNTNKLLSIEPYPSEISSKDQVTQKSTEIENHLYRLLNLNQPVVSNVDYLNRNNSSNTLSNKLLFVDMTPSTKPIDKSNIQEQNIESKPYTSIDQLRSIPSKMSTVDTVPSKSLCPIEISKSMIDRNSSISEFHDEFSHKSDCLQKPAPAHSMHPQKSFLLKKMNSFRSDEQHNSSDADSNGIDLSMNMETNSQNEESSKFSLSQLLKPEKSCKDYALMNVEPKHSESDDKFQKWKKINISLNQEVDSSSHDNSSSSCDSPVSSNETSNSVLKLFDLNTAQTSSHGTCDNSYQYSTKYCSAVRTTTVNSNYHTLMQTFPKDNASKFENLQNVSPYAQISGKNYEKMNKNACILNKNRCETIHDLTGDVRLDHFSYYNENLSCIKRDKSPHERGCDSAENSFSCQNDISFDSVCRVKGKFDLNDVSKHDTASLNHEDALKLYNKSNDVFNRKNAFISKVLPYCKDQSTSCLNNTYDNSLRVNDDHPFDTNNEFMLKSELKDHFQLDKSKRYAVFTFKDAKNSENKGILVELPDKSLNCLIKRSFTNKRNWKSSWKKTFNNRKKSFIQKFLMKKAIQSRLKSYHTERDSVNTFNIISDDNGSESIYSHHDSDT